MNHSYPRHIHFESVPNFRDLGGYRTKDGRTVAWRRIFRSAALHSITENDLYKLKNEIGPKTVIDLRNPKHDESEREVGLLKGIGTRRCHIPFRPDSSNYLKEEAELNPNATNMGDLYFYRIKHQPFSQRLIDALELIAEPRNHPLIFHCSVGKDRTGVLAAITLAALDVVDEEIIQDYVLSAPAMPEIRSRIVNDPNTAPEVKALPDFQWEATAESMCLFLAALRREYGSVRGYLETNGAEASLIPRLQKALLV